MNATVFSLYQASAEWQGLLGRIAENEGVLDDALVVEIHSLVNSGKSRIEDAVLAKRNLEVLAEQALAQAKVFAKEYERCKAIAETWGMAASKIGQAMVPVLELTGKVSTVAGTAFIRRVPTYSFALKQGAQFFELPPELWRQRDPELNRTKLKELAQTDRLPEQIQATKSETVSVCLKRPAARNVEGNITDSAETTGTTAATAAVTINGEVA